MRADHADALGGVVHRQALDVLLLELTEHLVSRGLHAPRCPGWARSMCAVPPGPGPENTLRQWWPVFASWAVSHQVGHGVWESIPPSCISLHDSART